MRKENTNYLLYGTQLLLRPGVTRYALLPIIINAALFTVMIILSVGQFDKLLTLIMDNLPTWLQWLDTVLWILFAMALVLLMASSFTIVANLVAAPFNSLLAEAVERHLTGHVDTDKGWWQTLKEIPRAFANEGRKLLYFARFAIPLLLLYLIPGVNLVAPLLWFGFSAWMLALEFSDYPLGNRGLSFVQQREKCRQHRLPVFGFGVTTLLGSMIPLINLVVIPSAVAGATALWLKQDPRQPTPPSLPPQP